MWDNEVAFTLDNVISLMEKTRDGAVNPALDELFNGSSVCTSSKIKLKNYKIISLRKKNIEYRMEIKSNIKTILLFKIKKDW